MSAADRVLAGTFIAGVLLVGLAFAAAPLITSWDRRLAHRAQPTAYLLGWEEPPARRRPPVRWTDAEARAEIFGPPGPHVRPQPAPTRPAYLDPDRTTTQIAVIDPPGGAW